MVESLDFAGSTVSNDRGRVRSEASKKGQAGSKAPKKHHKKHAHEIYEVDILYENQRGWFVCGIPLYSHSSLLNFDPSPWVSKDFKDSPVNITNAQVPDPTWEWEWKSWYVDMSYDVDEEGWQYSFSFSPKFSWHGTHPWFHSFVRRRRWLRKRVRRHHGVLGPDVKPSSMSQAHILTSDYFTIHPKRDRSRSTERDRASYMSVTTAGTAEPEILLEEITNIPALISALKNASIDREKLSLVRLFVSQGGDELAYLKDSIPEIMSFLVFQNSKRQLLSYLKKAGEEAEQHRQEKHKETDQPEGADEKVRADNLIAAVEAAEQQINGLEYWSDRQHVLRTDDDDEDDDVHDDERPGTADTSTYSKGSNRARKKNPMAQDEIRGIPSRAAVGVDPTEFIIARNLRSSKPGEKSTDLDGTADEDHDATQQDKGNRKRTESDDEAAEGDGEEQYESAESETSSSQEEEQEAPVQLPRDSLRIE